MVCQWLTQTTHSSSPILMLLRELLPFASIGEDACHGLHGFRIMEGSRVGGVGIDQDFFTSDRSEYSRVLGLSMFVKYASFGYSRSPLLVSCLVSILKA